MRTLAVLLLATTVAHAADDSVCKPFATELLNNQMTWLWTRAYSHCSLAEEDHPQPPPRGDWRAALDILDPDRVSIGPSGYAPGTDPWRAWCRRVWPRSFDGETVIFEADGRGQRARCPG